MEELVLEKEVEEVDPLTEMSWRQRMIEMEKRRKTKESSLEMLMSTSTIRIKHAN